MMNLVEGRAQNSQIKFKTSMILSGLLTLVMHS